MDGTQSSGLYVSIIKHQEGSPRKVTSLARRILPPAALRRRRRGRPTRSASRATRRAQAAAAIPAARAGPRSAAPAYLRPRSRRMSATSEISSYATCAASGAVTWPGPS